MQSLTTGDIKARYINLNDANIQQSDLDENEGFILNTKSTQYRVGKLVYNNILKFN